MELYIVLAIMAFMIVGFVWNKWPFGLTAMTCCVLLALTNVYPIDKAFAGFTNKNVILVAPMFVLSAAFGRTSLLRKIQDKMVVLKGKSGFVLLVALYAVVIALACFLPTTAEMTLMLMFLVSLGNTGDITPSRMTIPILGMLSMWGTKLPIGMGAAAYATYNVYYEGMVTNEGQLLGFLDQFKVAIIPCILVTIYCLFAYKLMPNTSFDETKLKEQKKQEALPKAKENIIYAVFVIVMGSLFFKHFICHQIRHTFQKHHTSGRQFHIFEPCIALNCLETFSCTHLLVSLDPFMALFIKRVHGRYVNPLCIPERKHPVFRKSRFSAPAPPCH